MTRQTETVTRIETREEPADVYVCNGCGRKAIAPSRFEVAPKPTLAGWVAGGSLDPIGIVDTTLWHLCPRCRAKAERAAGVAPTPGPGGAPSAG